MEISLESASLLVAIYGIGLIIFSIPYSILAMRFGFRKVGLGALVFLLIGTLLNSFAEDYLAMLIGRLLESLGFGLFVSLSLSMVALCFPPNGLGLALGIAGNAPSFGTFLALTVVRNFVAWGNWKLAWMLGAVFAFLSFIFWMAIRDPPILRSKISSASTYGTLPGQEESLNTFVAFKNRDHWLLCIALLLGFFFPNSTFTSLATSYFNILLGIDISAASLYASLPTLVGIPMGVIGGIISDKIRSRKKSYMLGFLASAVVNAAFTTATGPQVWLIPVLSTLLGVCMGFIVPATQASAKELLGPLAGVGISMQMTFWG
jgi:nitrate/nitrite transporter NarK